MKSTKKALSKATIDTYNKGTGLPIEQQVLSWVINLKPY